MAFENLQPLFGDKACSDGPVVVAGPCSAESCSQVLDTASGVSACGVKYFRAGVWKPRTRPGSFEGVGAEALKWLRDLPKTYGLLPVVEVAMPSHLRSALRAGIIAFWIGARTSANPFAVQELADILAQLPAERKSELSFLVKNPVNPDLELWIGALQRIYDAGIRRLGAIHRGFGVYGEKVYRNRPEWRIPIELKRRIPDLPLLCDPSHIGGRRELIRPLAQQAFDMNFDGLFIETHCNPDVALSDAAQQITPAELGELLQTLQRGGVASTGATTLQIYRQEIDNIDEQLIDLLSRRMQVAREIGEYKKRENLSVVQPDRYSDLIKRCVEQGKTLGLSESFMRDVLAAIHQESVRQQIDVGSNHKAAE